MKMMNKKAQLTLFIIVGIIILLGVGLSIYISSVKKIETIGPETIVEEVPVQFQPLRDFIGSCLIKTSEDALDKIGKTGGYTDLRKRGIISNQLEPTESNAFRFFPEDENSEIVYWHYFKSSNECKNNCKCSSEMPYLRKEDGSPSIEEEIERYIDSNIESCLGNFESFKNQGYIIDKKDDAKTTATIAENNIPILLKYPIKAKRGESEADIEDFFVRIPLDFYKIYELASEITEKEMKYPFLERWTQEEINAFGLGVDKDSIPPTTAVSFDPGQDPVMWSKEKTKDIIINNILVHYTPLFQVFNTANYRDRTGSYYERTTLPIASPTGRMYYDLEANFEYMNWWPIYLDITGRGVSGDIIGPEKSSFPLLDELGVLIGSARYNIYYDISYPVKVNIHDSKALNSRGYDFSFGLEANVRNNKPLNCSGTGTPLVLGPASSQLCDQSQACANITIIAWDAKEDKPIEGVLISYGEADDQCDIGRTSEEENEVALKAALPSCIGCSLKLTKTGYFSQPLLTTVRCDNKKCNEDDVLCNDESIIIELEPKRTKNITVKKKRMMKTTGWNLDNAPVNLLNDESAIITIKKMKEHFLEEDISITRIIDGNQSSVELENSLVPGIYSASIQLMYNIPDSSGRKEIVFKEKEICTSSGPFSDDECNTYGPQAINNTFIEGVSEVNFSISKKNIDNFNTIVFYVISSPDSSSFDMLDMDDIEMMGKSSEFNEKYKVELKPRFE